MQPTSEYEFRAFVDRLFVKQRDGVEGLLHAAVGLAGESGEVLDLIKKVWVYDKPLDREKLIEEMGDVTHYLMMLCIKLQIDFQVLMENNVAKLKKRYPDGYSDAAALARADQAVRT